MIGPGVSEKKCLKSVRRTTEHGYSISSPCAPNGSGEQKKKKKLNK